MHGSLLTAFDVSESTLPSALLDRSRQALLDGQHRDGLEWAEQARQRASAANDTSAEATARGLEAQHLWRLGRFEDAASAAHDAADRWQALGDAAAQCEALGLHAMSCSELGLPQLGLQSAQAMLELARRHSMPRETGQALNRLGHCHERLGNPAEAERLLRQALGQARAVDSVDDTLSALNNLTATALGGWHLYSRRGENVAAHDALARALDHGREAVAMCARGIDPYRRIVTQGNLGEVLGHARDFDEAERLLADTIAQARAGGFRAVEMRTRHNLGEMRAAQGRHDEAVSELTAVLDELRRGSDHESTRMRVHAALWRTYKALGQFEPALAHCESYHAIELQRAMLQGQAQARLLSRLPAPVGAEAAPAPAPAPPSAEPAVSGELQNLLEQARQRRKPLAVAAIEVENHAALVAQFGAGAVDVVFRDIAQRIRLRLRPRDLALRLNPRCWLVVLTDTPPAAAAAICERLRAAVEQDQWRAIADGLQLRLCLGLVTGVTESDAALVLQRAETALRRAREAGTRRTVGA